MKKNVMMFLSMLAVVAFKLVAASRTARLQEVTVVLTTGNR